MKKIFIAIVLAFLLIAGGNEIKAQENYNALNMTINLGTSSLFNVNYEFTVYDQVTVAPVVLIDFDGNFGVGARGAYYFDELFFLNGDWDVWAGVDLGYRFGVDDFGYGFVMGGEWHFTETWGFTLELNGGNLATGIGAGVAVHF
jgi:hypothetical protein